MDPQVLGRNREDEVAILEELSTPVAIARADRRWLLALAGVAAIVCLGFVGSVVSPPRPPDPPAITDAFTPAERAGHETPTPAIELLAPADGAAVTGGRVPVRLRAAPESRVHVSITVGDAVLGWRNVIIDETGSWAGDVRVSAPRAALPAVVHAVTPMGGSAAKASAAFVLDGGAQVILWDASVVRGSGGSMMVRYRTTAPLDFGDVKATVTDATGRALSRSVVSASRVEAWQPGSAGGREVGLGIEVGTIRIRPTTRPIVLHLAWHDPATGDAGALERVLGQVAIGLRYPWLDGRQAQPQDPAR